MIYKFKSKAAGDVIMLGPTGDRVLAVMGKTPAPKGIIEPADMPAAMAALAAAVQADDAVRAQAASAEAADAVDSPVREAISLRQRAWPLLVLMEHSLAADVPVVWGV